MNIRIRKASLEDIGNVQWLLNDALSYKISRGDFAWDTSVFSAQEVEDLLKKDDSFIACQGDETIGFFRLQAEDARAWGKRGLDKKALYIHQLVSSSKFRGSGVGQEMLLWISQEAKRLGKDLLRLDCEEKNVDLCNYYISNGFRRVGQKELGGYKGCLLEKKL